LQMPGNTGTTVLDADVNTGSIIPGLDGESLNRLPDHRLGGVANDISKNLIQLSRDTPYQGQIILKLPLFFNLELEERLTVEEKDLLFQELVDLNPLHFAALGRFEPLHDGRDHLPHAAGLVLNQYQVLDLGMNHLQKFG